MEMIRLGALALLLIISVYTDLSRRKIYNWATYPAIGFGIGIAGGEVLIHDQWVWMTPAILGMLSSSIVFGIPYLLGWLGAGDLKLLIAVGALQGSPFGALFILNIFYNTALCGAIMALLILVWRGELLKGLLGSLKLFVKPKQQVSETISQATLPYGVAIALGTFLSIARQLHMLP